MKNEPSIQVAATSPLTRRDFLKFSMLMAGVLALPRSYAGRIAQALAAATRLPVVWLEFQDCTGDSESLLRANQRVDPIQPGVTDPGVTDLLLDFISLEYHETLMASSGANSEKSLADVMQTYPGEYVVVVEGSIPSALNGAYCAIRGRSALSIVREVCAGARAVIGAGSCAFDGGLAAAAPNPTGATGVRGAVPGLTNLVNLPGCPVNVVNLVAVIVHLITFGEMPACDSLGRPYFAYGEDIHEECERHNHYEAERFALAWGDEGHRRGWCLYRLGCKGPATHNNCSRVLWNDGVCWPVRAGHGCAGCSEPHFWDNLTPLYSPLPDDDAAIANP